MRRLYSARVARPLSSANTRPTRLGYATTAWCPYEDLIAVISGCGGVAVFHADSPGEVALLIGDKRSPARHIVWRNSPDKPLMLVVSDASGTISFWLSCDRRVNVWYLAESVQVPSVTVALGWNSTSTAVATVLAHGGLAVWLVPDHPSSHQSRSQRVKPRDLDNRRTIEAKYANSIRSVACKNLKLTDLFGGQLRCGTVAAGYVDPNGVALVTVSVTQPKKLSVWSVSIFKQPSPSFEVRPLCDTAMDAQSGSCISCAAVPPSGMLFAIGDGGVIARWHLKQSRPSTDFSWTLQSTARIDRETEDAVARGEIPEYEPTTHRQSSGSKGLEIIRRRKIYAFEISSDCKSLLTSSAYGLLRWNTEKLKVDGGFRIERGGRLQRDLEHSSPYWGVCLSPTGSAAFALNGSGFVHAFSLITPIVRSNPEATAEAAHSVMKRLLTIPFVDGLRGGWDLLSSIAFEGPRAAELVSDALMRDATASAPNMSFTSEKVIMTRSLMQDIIYAEDASAAVARKLLELASDAIRKSAPDSVILKLSVSAKDAKLLTSPANISKGVRQTLSSTSRVSPTQLSAAPLADWVMVLCAIWLQRCAEILAKHDTKGEHMRIPWFTVAAMATRNEKNKGPGHGIVYDTMLVRALRPASVAALTLLALEDEHGEPDIAPRYFRFSREETNSIVAALWEVSLAWESVDSMSRPIGGNDGPPSMRSGHSTEQMVNTAIVLGKHLAAAKVLGNAKELRVSVAEKALGLHGASKGAGFIMSLMRSHQGEDGPGGPGEETNNSSSGRGQAEWCQYDIITGRPLPPWAPLRRCVVSGLLAAEITQQKSDTVNVNIISPWITKWAEESPFGGRWARVPSLDLDRYELLPAVYHPCSDRLDASAQAVGPSERHLKTEDVLQAAGLQGNSHSSRAHPHIPTQTVPPNLQDPFLPVSKSLSAAGSDASGFPPPHTMHTPSGSDFLANGLDPVHFSQATHGTSQTIPQATGAVQVKSQSSLVPAPAPTEGGSSISRGGKKRPPGRGTRRPRKRPATEPRTPTSGQPSDLSGALVAGGIGGASSPAMNMFGRPPSAADAMSTDTRSTATGATNATGGAATDTSRRGRNRRRPPQPTGSMSTPVGSGIPGMNVGVGSNPGPHFGQTGINQPPGRGAAPRRPQQGPSQSNPAAVAAAAAGEAAAAAAAAAAAVPPVSAANKQPMRSHAMLQTGPNANNLGNLGLDNGSDPMSHLGFMNENSIGSGNMLEPGGGNAFNRNVSGSMGIPGNVNFLNGLSGGNNLGTGNGLNSDVGGLSTNDGVNGLNGQSGFNTNLLQQHLNPGSNPGLTSQGGAGQPWAALANLGLNLNGLSPEQTHRALGSLHPSAIEALHRKAVMQAVAAQGTNDVPVVSAGMGLDMGMLNSNGLPSGGINGIDVLGNGPRMGISDRAMPTISNGASNTPGVIPMDGPDDPGGQNVVGGLGGVRTSRAESVTSAPGRASVPSLDNVGIGGVPPSLMLGSNRDTFSGIGGPENGLNSRPGGAGRMSPGAGGMNNDLGRVGLGFGDVGSGLNGGIAVGGGHDNSGMVSIDNNGANGGGSNNELPVDRNGGMNDGLGMRIWKGNVQAHGQEGDLLVPCVGIRYNLQGKHVITDASSWPTLLHCDSSNLLPHCKAMDHARSPTAQWYVRFVVVNENGNEQRSKQLCEMVTFIESQKMAFGIRCNQPEGMAGTLYLWGMAVPNVGPSLLGVFIPTSTGPPAPDIGVDDFQQFMMMGDGTPK